MGAMTGNGLYWMIGIALLILICAAVAASSKE